jgi:hypothetical protein
MRYRARVDWWIGAAMASGIVVPGLAALVGGTAWVYLASATAAVAVFGFACPQWYETAPDALVIRAGLTARRIPYGDITSVRPASDGRSTIAISHDRVEIEYGGKRLLIAPDDWEAFFRDLEARAPQLARRGPDLVASLV